MKQIALYEAKNSLSALIDEVEASGEEIVITRHGKPVVRLAPVEGPALKTRREAIDRLAAIQAEAERRLPEARPLPWETLKAWARDEEEGGDAA